MANESPIPVVQYPVTIPTGYPTVPTPGKLSLLLQANDKKIYHSLSPWATDTYAFGNTSQPFHYTHIGDSYDAYASQNMPFSRAIIDVQRVTKFISSGAGVLFLGRQLLLQSQALRPTAR